MCHLAYLGHEMAHLVNQGRWILKPRYFCFKFMAFGTGASHHYIIIHWYVVVSLHGV